MGYREVVLEDDPEGYWPLDETSGTVVYDQSGHGRNGTIHAGTMLGQDSLRPDCLPGTAWRLNGSVQGASIPSDNSWQVPAAFTAEIWVWLDQWQLGNSPIVFAKAVAEAPNAQGTKTWLLAVGDTNGAPPARLDARIAPNALGRVLISPREFTLAQPHYCAVTWDGAVGRLYEDGDLMVETSAAGPLHATNEPLTIGRSSGTYPYEVRGLLQHAAFYSHALTPERIAARWACADEVVRMWPRDDALGLGAAPRLVPPPRHGRLVGGQD